EEGARGRLQDQEQGLPPDHRAAPRGDEGRQEGGTRPLHDEVSAPREWIAFGGAVRGWNSDRPAFFLRIARRPSRSAHPQAGASRRERPPETVLAAACGPE